MIDFSKVDPHVIKMIIQRTSKTSVKSKEESFIFKDAKKNKERTFDLDLIKRKIKRANLLFKENNIDIYIELVSELIGSHIQIVVCERSTDKLLYMFDEEMFLKFMDELVIHTGIIIDSKG